MRPSLSIQKLLLGATLVVATFLAFAPVRDNGFVGFDDPRYIVANERVRQGLTLDGVAWAFTSTHAYNWHPLTWISHMADVELFGLDPGAHHLVNVALHAANALLLFVLLESLTAALWPSALVAFLHALHPLRVESVAWASERKDVLGALLWLVTMLAYAAYTRRPRKARYGLVMLAFAAGLLAKPMLVTLPFVLLLLDFWPLGRLRIGSDDATRSRWVSASAGGGRPSSPRSDVPGRRGRASGTARRSSGRRRGGKAPPVERARTTADRAAAASTSPAPAPSAVTAASVAAAPLHRLLLEKVPLLALAAAASAATLYAQRGIVQSAESFPIATRLANAVVSCVRYLGKMVWPADLAVFYPYRERTFASLEVWGALAVLAVLSLSAVALRRRGYPIVGWLWFLGALVPVLGLVQAGIQSMADRYTYLPGIGVLLAVVWGGREILERGGMASRAGGRLAVPAAASTLIVFLGALTFRQTLTWRDDETLYRHAASVTENSYWATYNLGLTLLDRGRASEASTWFERAARLEPTSLEAHTNLGRALEQAGRVDQAIAALRRAVEIAPEDPIAARHLTRILVTTGRAKDAAVLAGGAVGRWPDDSQLHYTLGLARILLEDPTGAVEPLERAVSLEPSHAAAHNALGIALARTGSVDRARAHFERAVEIEPGYQEARDNLARLIAAPPAAPSK